MNATEDNVIKDIMTVFRLKRKNNAIKDKIIRGKRTYLNQMMKTIMK